MLPESLNVDDPALVPSELLVNVKLGGIIISTCVMFAAASASVFSTETLNVFDIVSLTDPLDIKLIVWAARTNDKNKTQTRAGRSMLARFFFTSLFFI